MTILHRVRTAVRRLGIDVVPYPRGTHDFRVAQLLCGHGVEVVLDVGAHTGAYAAMLRRCGYRGRIVSFEPIGDLYQLLRRRAARDPLWEVWNCAIGDTSGGASIHVAGNAGASSSLLPMLDRHTRAAAGTEYVRTEEVLVQRLDELWPWLLRPQDRPFLKVDVQGFEKQVLVGTGTYLEHCCGLQLEVSFAPLYEGGMLYREALDLAHAYGFELMSVVPGFTDPASGRMYQCDAVMFREPR